MSFDGLRQSLRRSGWSLLSAIAVISALAVTVAFVHARAGEKDTLRQAQIGIVKAPGALHSVVQSPVALLAGTPAAPSEFPVSETLRARLMTPVAEFAHFWHTPLARTLTTHVAQINARTAEMMKLIAGHRLHEANAIHAAYVQPLTSELETEIAQAEHRLAQAIAAADGATWRATLGLVGGIGALVVLLLIVLAGARRRHQRTEIERRSHERLQALVEHGSDMITVVKQDTTVIYQAGATVPMLGYERHELEGSRLLDWVIPDDQPLLRVLCATECATSQELRLRHRDGFVRTCQVHATSLLDDPAWEGIVINIWDLSERKALEERLRHQAFHDSLTGLPNRALVLDRAEQMLTRAKRQSNTVAALYIDIDGFKHVNDSLGHAAGDELLQIIGRRLSEVVRDQDTVGRLGGDEFVVLLESAEHDASPELIGERILQVLGAPIELQGSSKPISIGASIGIAVGSRESADDLLRDADFALYEVKESGKNRYAFFETRMQSAAQDRLTLELNLYEALEQEQFFLLYQPTVDLQTQRVVGAEALIRWSHPNRGVVTPDEFIPLAEETGLIVPIGRWVLNEACRQAAIWHSEGHQIDISVNLSAHQLNHDGLLEDVSEALGASGIDPSALTLELTETALMRDMDQAAEQLNALKEIGVRIAIDDFGTGYGSLAYLRQFPIDTLKIDRSFVTGLAASRESEAIIHTLVQLGKALKIETLAEGIEEPAQLEQLQRERCDHGQGFLFARPLDVHAIKDFLEATPHDSRDRPAQRQPSM
jgi:diguanylate cyclase (GGDEF)-like protein/PAS domain S-box-containing protein